MLLNLDECISNNDIKKKSESVIILLQKNLLRLKQNDAYKTAEKLEKIKQLLVKGKTIEEQETQEYLTELYNFIEGAVYRDMND